MEPTTDFLIKDLVAAINARQPDHTAYVAITFALDTWEVLAMWEDGWGRVVTRPEWRAVSSPSQGGGLDEAIQHCCRRVTGVEQ